MQPKQSDNHIAAKPTYWQTIQQMQEMQFPLNICQ